MAAASEKNARVTLVVEGRRFSALTKDGGGVDSEEKKLRPAGGDPEVSLGGVRTRDTATLEFLEHAGGDDLAYLEARCGRADALVIIQPLDNADHAIGAPESRPGTLKSAKPSKRDANSSDEARFTVEVTLVAD